MASQPGERSQARWRQSVLRALRLPLIALCLGSCLTSARPALAYTWMLRHGLYKCDACHTDPSGGETLTKMGRVKAEHLLSWRGDSMVAPSQTSEFLFGLGHKLAPVRVGASYRHLGLYRGSRASAEAELVHFPMQADAYASVRASEFVFSLNLGVARGIEGSAHARGAQLNRELGDGWLLLSRNHYVGVYLADQTLLRVGRFSLPFGLRVPEHVLWVREATRTDRESDQQHGLSLYHAKGPLRFEGMLIAGNFQTYPDRYRERGYSAFVEYLVAPTSALGVSSLVTRSNEDRLSRQPSSVRHSHGVMGRFGVSPEVVLLGEIDLLLESGRSLGHASVLQLDYEALRGMHFMVTGETLDQGLLEGTPSSAPGSGTPRLGLWLSTQWFLYSHFDLRLDVVTRQGAPLTVQGQAHVYL